MLKEKRMTYAAEQQVNPVAGHLYPAFPAPVVPHVPSTDIVTPDRGVVQAVLVLE